MMPAVLIQKKLDGLAALLAFSALCMLASYLLNGCGAASAEGAYGAELARCVDKATTLAESRACRRSVGERWQVDAGVAP